MYSNTEEDIKVGDIVSVEGEDGEHVVLDGNGGAVSNPLVKVRSLVRLSDKIVSCAKLTFIRRNEQEANIDEPLLGQLNQEFRNALGIP